MQAIFQCICPNCYGEIDDVRLGYGLPCDKCLPVSIDSFLEKTSSDKLREYAYEYLRRENKLANYKFIVEINKELEKLDSLFYELTGSRLWSAQRTWARRALNGRSFAIIAPTGMGKTVFGIFLSIYYASRGRKSYILVPTAVLADQIRQKLESFLGKLSSDIKIACYHSLLSEKIAKKELAKIKNGDFDILVTTSSFLVKNFELIRDRRFDLIFVDDVDAFLKSSKNVDKVLILLGLNESIIDAAFHLVILREKFARYIRRGETETDPALKLKGELVGLENTVRSFLAENRIGQLIVSGASIRAKRTRRVKLFKELLDFELGSRTETMRNIEDIYVYAKDEKRTLLELINKLGDGGLIFIPMDRGVEYAENIAEFLNENGIKALAYTKPKRKAIKAFSEGEYDLLIGIASYRSPLSRGLDIPHRIRYAIFLGVPKFKISLDIQEDFSPLKAIILLANLRELVSKEEQNLADKYIASLRNFTRLLNRGELEFITKSMKEGVKLRGFYGRCQEIFEEARSFLNKMLSREDIKKRIEETPDILMEEINGKHYLVVPDARAYLQASGRTSRMYVGGISKGLSVLIVDETKAFEGLKRELKWYLEDIEWKELGHVDLNSIVQQINADRELIKMLMRGEVRPEFKDIIKTVLLVVESPSKARTIARFFGRAARRKIGVLEAYEVSLGNMILVITSTGGHLFDVVVQTDKPNSIHGILKIDDKFVPLYFPIRRCNKCGESYAQDIEKCTFCGSQLEDKLEVIKSLREMASEVDYVYIGTDADSEGEKIGWDIAQALGPYANKIERIEFHEVTRRAILDALKSPRSINLKLVQAQIARRVEDRWIGFELSMNLWKVFNNSRLSAGRVQTPVLGWVVNRTSNAKRSVMDYFEITLENGVKFVISTPYRKAEEVRKYIEQLKSSECKIENVVKEEVEIKPPPPFSTDTMLYEASQKLKMNVNETMTLAQHLFELGLITYHRTDSIRVSTVGQSIAKEYIKEELGEELYTPRSWSTEGAHECIRPTRPLDSSRLRQLLAMGILRLARKLTDRHLLLYDLIFRRFIMSQMPPAKVIRQRFDVVINGHRVRVEGYSSVLESGFALIRQIPLMPEVSEGDVRVVGVRHWRAPSTSYFTQGEIIDAMKKKGIGRPSTYAKVVHTLFQRRYIKETKKGYVVSTKMGFRVFNYLKAKFSQFVSEETTRRLEEIMDSIELGRIDYQDVLRELYRDIMAMREQKIEEVAIPAMTEAKFNGPGRI